MILMTYQEFIQDVSKAEKASENEPVFISDKGEITHVFMGYGQYKTLKFSQKSVADLLASPEVEKGDSNETHTDQIDLPLKRDKPFSREVDFS